MNSIQDELFMQRCLQLAQLGAGQVAPNPMVGAVLVHQGRIIGEGYHRRYGQAHAEVDCVQRVAAADRSLIPRATMYVSLEPCAHYGKTPPCADMIVQQQIPRVVIGCTDSFSEVSGKGIEKLQQAGVEVSVGMLERASRELNRRFFTFHEKKRPYIVLKWAQCPAGFMATLSGEPVRLSNQYSDRLVHRWRSEEMAILVGTNTALTDDPQLTTRHWPGKSPLRLVIDRELKTPRHYRLWDNSVPTWFFTEKEETFDGQTATLQLDFRAPLLPQLMERLYEKNITSVMVEGGAYVLQRFIEAGLWDEARVISGTSAILPEGQKAPVLPRALLIDETTLEGDRISYYRNIT
ncbi:bifunctional diaminohydroxyphosphoribosylaminopyrimidine deaminase/5-amino-6-(5-phosphoribosylamino)uracil reductase RibD [uncultured Chitinophaga sp.]|jgi:riboflavin biosynthesis protein RibD|uniref:bifunctional diaminohydroxyphosphoribosylaminopyrimidine deaminase/5-amino-6-(5-phosphoribosylamino)uracil reductase RibD n=1 Tax=uncultured Chitinophaga sp. TaxID=339340 RepID=UPI002627D9A0|nr:bifunctional diaminohydroxyphosphoribosylaminopyrimidine deaminase/5-amino-6-(5-phosphoribosylamino)uracil reductase RibD [uncultured Chitinophaga sp.]